MTHPSLIGFERIMDMMNNLETMNVNRPKYPPYNLIKLPDNKYQLELAVAGFRPDELKVEFVDNSLHVTGQEAQPEIDVEYVYRGISSRDFKQTFRLAETVEVRDAMLLNGKLVILLENVIPEAKKPRVIAIKDNVDDWKSIMDKPNPQLLTEEKAKKAARK
jgi:molecular chaperone IbpA